MGLGLGFTLVEILVVISLVGIVLGMGFSTLASTLRSSVKSTIFSQVKQTGDLTMEIMTRTIRSAIDVCVQGDDLTIYSSSVNCVSPPSGPSTRFRCTEGNPGGLTDDEQNGKIERFKIDSDGNVVPQASGTLTSGVRVKDGEESCVFAVTNTIPKRVVIDFILTQAVRFGNNVDTAVTIPFHTEISLRNF